MSANAPYPANGGPQFREKKLDVPAGLWMRCTGCEAMLYRKTVTENLEVCPECGHHFRVGGRVRIEQLCDRIALDLKRNHQFADSQQPARDCQGTSCRNHADRCAFSEQTGMRLLVEVKRERHEAIFVGVSGNHPVQCSEAAAHRGDGRWAIVVPHHLGAERRRFGGHPILDPKTGDPCYIRETRQELEVDPRPELWKKEVVERIDTRIRRQPWTVNDQCNR